MGSAPGKWVQPGGCAALRALPSWGGRRWVPWRLWLRLLLKIPQIWSDSEYISLSPCHEVLPWAFPTRRRARCSLWGQHSREAVGLEEPPWARTLRARGGSAPSPVPPWPWGGGRRGSFLESCWWMCHGAAAAAFAPPQQPAAAALPWARRYN